MLLSRCHSRWQIIYIHFHFVLSFMQMYDVKTLSLQIRHVHTVDVKMFLKRTKT